MANLKDLIVNGDTRLVGDLYANKLGSNIFTHAYDDAVGASSCKMIVCQSDTEKGTTPAKSQWHTMAIAVDSSGSIENTHKYGQIETAVTSAGVVSTRMQAYKNVEGATSAVALEVGWTSAGTSYTRAITPDANSSSTDIATTAWVKNNGVSLTSAGITSALGYTPYNSTNPNGYTSVTSTTVSGWGYTKTAAPSNVTTAANGLMLATDKVKLNGIASGATSVTSATVSGWGYTKTAAPSNVTTAANGLMLATDKVKLDGIASGATSVTSATISGWGYTKNTGTLTAHQTNLDLGQGYGTCATAAATVAKVGTLANYVLTTGGIVAIKFTYAVPASATLNINSKGAKNMRHRGANITAGVINAGDTATFIYDGTYYELIAVDKPKIMELTQSEYDAISTKDANTYYFIKA